MSRLLVSLLGAASSLGIASTVFGATLAEWNFNAFSSPANPSTGTGTCVGFGSGLAFPFTPNLTGSPGDPNPAVNGSGSLNNNAAVRSGAALGSASGIRGIDVKTSTAGRDTPTISWHLLAGYRTSRYYQILATTDGTNYSPVPTGTGSTAATLGAGTQTSSSATVSNSGLVTIIAKDGLIPATTNGDAFIYSLSYTFPTGTAYDNNPNFGVRIVSTWDPSGTDYVSSFAGTTSTDAAKGYSVTTTAGGGSVRYDMINISAVPEPTALALAGLGGTFALGRRRR
jgi:hypothetical protein